MKRPRDMHVHARYIKKAPLVVQLVFIYTNFLLAMRHQCDGFGHLLPGPRMVRRTKHVNARCGHACKTRAVQDRAIGNAEAASRFVLAIRQPAQFATREAEHAGRRVAIDPLIFST
eukprot:scaffold266862_cov35-Tisochrysis_lutea.AAC.3